MNVVHDTRRSVVRIATVRGRLPPRRDYSRTPGLARPAAAQRRSVGVLDEHPSLGEAEADLFTAAECRVDVDAGPQSLPADVEDPSARQALESVMQVRTEFG